VCPTARTVGVRTRDQLAGRIQETYGITKHQAEVQVKAFEEANKDFESKTSA
jgi:hypothetical protein